MSAQTGVRPYSGIHDLDAVSHTPCKVWAPPAVGVVPPVAAVSLGGVPSFVGVSLGGVSQSHRPSVFGPVRAALQP